MRSDAALSSPDMLVATASTAVLALAVVPALDVFSGVSGRPRRAAKRPEASSQNTHPSWAVRAAEVAKAPASKPMSARVYLMPRRPAALDRRSRRSAPPAAPATGTTSPPPSSGRQYGPAPDAVSEGDHLAQASGLKVSAPQQNGRYVESPARSKTPNAPSARSLSLYHRDGGTYQAPAAPSPSPTDVSSYVLTVTGLDEAPATRLARRRPSACSPSQYTAQIAAEGAGGGLPARLPQRQALLDLLRPAQGQLRSRLRDALCRLSWVGPGPTRSVATSPAQLRSAYGAPSALTGKGVTVAIIDAYQSPTLASDANRYASTSATRPSPQPAHQPEAARAATPTSDACDAAGWSGSSRSMSRRFTASPPAPR